MNRILQTFLLCICALYLVPVEAAPLIPDCKSHILAAPPHVRDPLFGEALNEQAKLALALRLKQDCIRNRWIDDEVARTAFDYMGINSFFTKPLEELSRGQIVDLQQQTQATHLVGTKKTDEETLSITVYRITPDYQLQKALGFTHSLTQEAITALPQTPTSIRWLALLTPNTATLGFVNTQADAWGHDDSDDPYTAMEVTHRGNLPPILSSIGLNKIEHPDAYGLFDVSGSIFPSTYFFAIDQETRFSKTGSHTRDDSDRYLDLKLYGLCGNFNAMGMLYWPLGTTYTGIGIGPCTFQKRKDHGTPLWYLDGAIRLIFGHRIFVKRDLYIFLEFDNLNFFNPLYRTYYAESSSISRATLGLGYYLPDVEHLYAKTANKWFGKWAP